MAYQTYSSPAGRINEVLGEMLAVAEINEELSKGCSMRHMPRNKGKTITYRARIPHGGATTNANTINRWSLTAAAHQLVEGVSPNVEALEYRNVSVEIQEYGAAYGYTNQVELFYEDDVPRDQVMQLSERISLVREMIRYGEMKASTTVIYSGGTTRATVDEAISVNNLSLMARTLRTNGAKMKSTQLAASPNYETSAIPACYIAFVHPDALHDIERLEGWVPREKYGTKSSLSNNEHGSVGAFRIIWSKELGSYADAGAAVGSTGLKSTSASNIDVYPTIVCAEEAVFDVALKMGDGVNLRHLKPGQIDKSDFLGQRGIVAANFFAAAKVVNNGWIGVIETGVSSLA